MYSTNQPTNLQLGPVQGDCEKSSGLFVWLTIMMQAIIHEKANQILTLIWIWRVADWQCSVICHMNNHIFFSQFNRHVLHSRERNIMFLSALWWLTVFSELAGSCLAASAAQSCMGLGKHGLTHWDPRSTGLANNCHHILLIFCEIALGRMSIIWSQFW